MEYAIYKLLDKREGIPKVYECTAEGKYNILIMELLGKSLEKLFKVCQKKFTIPTGFALALQMV